MKEDSFFVAFGDYKISSCYFLYTVRDTGKGNGAFGKGTRQLLKFRYRRLLYFFFYLSLHIPSVFNQQ